jgi:hypothetical protein
MKRVTETRQFISVAESEGWVLTNAAGQIKSHS